MIYIGTAGWSLSRGDQMSFPPEGTHLERYAAVFDGAEINSSFYRPHRPELYVKWAAATRPDFRFSVKLPKRITHEARLVGVEPLLDAFLDQVASLGDRLGCILVQLPPSLEYEQALVSEFFAVLRARFDGPVVAEPRHATWFGTGAARVMAQHRIARVAADPPRVPEAAVPGGDDTVVYYRLHGSPRIYWSAYDEAYLDRLAAQLRAATERTGQVWCIFDNTASGSAIPNAWSLLERFL